MVPTNDEKLMFYSLYKQATEGKNKNAQPNFLHFLQKSKNGKTRMIESNECFENFSSIEFREFEEREALK
ncbi:acyl-CoA binding protein [Wuchereria bancrofti]|uniref:Acyl-CoA binding protein n=1 Tax=Wuchereria bancrofti TaxID=6293 RepID=J9EZF8_WUCBA|nr:acyl-CoA binding protein [Wuchereria bancrofti]